MAKQSSPTLTLSLFHPTRNLIAFICLLSLLLHHLSASATPLTSHFEGFDDADEDEDDFAIPPLTQPPPPISLSPKHSVSPPPDQINNPNNADPIPNPTTAFDDQYWDEDEFEGFPDDKTVEPKPNSINSSESEPENSEYEPIDEPPRTLASYSIEIGCVSFLIAFAINYFTGKKQNENLALAWARKFGAKGSIFEKNFSFLGVGETEDSPLLLQEGNNVFKFYCSGRRFCTGLLATMELKSRHDLIAKLYNMVVPCKDLITIEAYMNAEAMDHVVFALARKKMAKAMHKEFRDLQRFAVLVQPMSGRKWVAEELQVVAESKEVAGDLVNDTVLEQVFSDKVFGQFGKDFISMHISDQHSAGSRRKMLVFKFALPDADHMADMARLVALVPYYIDLIGRYKVSSHARSKTEAARSKVAEEIYKELQIARQEALQKRKAEQRKKLEEAEAKLSSEALRKKEAKDRARQMKKAMPKVKMSRGG